MKIGCPTEIKPQEFRVGLTPEAAQEIVARGHEVLIQKGAGEGSAIHDPDFTAAGATRSRLRTAVSTFCMWDMSGTFGKRGRQGICSSSP